MPLSSGSGTASPLAYIDHKPFVAGTFQLVTTTGAYGRYNAATFSSTETWLHASQYTNANDVVEVTAIYLGRYTGRAPLVYVIIHKDWVQLENGFIHVVRSISADLDHY